MIKVTVQDAISLGYCIKGIREFCKTHGIDFREFVRDGIDEEVLLSTKDAMALKVVELAHIRVGER